MSRLRCPADGIRSTDVPNIRFNLNPVNLFGQSGMYSIQVWNQGKSILFGYNPSIQHSIASMEYQELITRDLEDLHPAQPAVMQNPQSLQGISLPSSTKWINTTSPR